MDNNKIIERIISRERFAPYLEYNKDNIPKAMEHYKTNILISESFYPLISILEVGLRNSMNFQLGRKFETLEWYDNSDFIDLASSFQIERIKEAKNNLKRDDKELTTGRVIAALSFGFWTSFFDSRFEKSLWKSLRMTFPHCPKNIRKRGTISANLNKIRKFRNRLFHHEAISWDLSVVETYKKDIVETILWLEKDLQLWLNEFSRTKEVIEQAQKTIR